MNRKLKGLISVAGGALLAFTVFAQVPHVSQGEAFCSCPSQAAFDHTLPMSHPINRCAAEQASGVSWSTWFSGNSGSYQFHYLDLLELLSRVTEQPKNQSPTT